MTNNELLQVLTQARLQVASGWCRGRAHRFNPETRRVERCLSAALHCAVALRASQGLSSTETIPDLNEVCIALGFRSIGATITWNDDPNRSQEAVLARLDRTLEKLSEA